jgi:hypothetical protein
MEGLALVWFEAMIEDEVDSYTEFKKHFGKKFCKSGKDEDHQRKLYIED